LPGGTDSINIAKILSGTAVGIQTVDNEPVTDVDQIDTFINAPAISGQQGVAIQLLDQSPTVFDEIIFRDLTDAVAVNAFKDVIVEVFKGIAHTDDPGTRNAHQCACGWCRPRLAGWPAERDGSDTRVRL
jgi:hypothetical protein